MATKYNSVQNTNFTTSIGGAPSAADTVIVNDWALDYSAGTNISASGDLAVFHIRPQSRCNFAGTGELVTEAASFINEGSQDRLELRGSATSTTFDAVRNNPVLGTSTTTVGSGIYTAVAQISGILTLTDQAEVTTLEISGGQTILMSHATAATTVTITDGTGLTERDIGTLNVHGGTFSIDATGVTPTTVNQNGGTLVVTESGDWTTFNGNAGVLDLTRNSRAFTIGTFNERPGLTILKSQRTVEPTITTTNRPYGPAKVRYVD